MAMNTRVLVLPFLLAPLAAQAASIATYGSGCVFANQTLAIGFAGLPQLGTTFDITYSGPHMNQQLSVQPILGLGLTASNLPIPASILPQQPPNCTEWIDPIVLTPMGLAPAGGFATQTSIVVPNTATLIGFQLTAQWLGLAIQCGFVPPCWLSGLPTSDALLITVGL
jgi:hypothetical protein